MVKLLLVHGLFPNKQFYDWNNFNVKLLLRFRQWSFASSMESLTCFDSISVAPIALPEVISVALESDLNKAKQREEAESKNSSDLDGGNSRFADNYEVPPEILDALIGNFSHPTDFTSSMMLISSNCDEVTLLEIKIDEEEYSKNFAHKVFAEIPYREIAMDFEHSIQTTTQVFNEMSHNYCSKVLNDEFDLDDDNSEKNKVLAKNSQQDTYGLPSQNVEAPSRYYSIMGVDDCKEIIKILACHINSTSNDNCILKQFPFDPGADMFIVLQVNKEFAERSTWLLNPVSPQISWLILFPGREYILPFDKMFLVPNKDVGWFDTRHPSSLMPLTVVQRRLIYLRTTPATATVFSFAIASDMESGNSKGDQVSGAMSNGVYKVFKATPTSLLVGVLVETAKQMRRVQQCHFKDGADFLISFGRQESEMSVVYLAQALPARCQDSNSLYSVPALWKLDFAVFEDMCHDNISMAATLIEDPYLDKLFVETLRGAPMSEMHSDDCY